MTTLGWRPGRRRGTRCRSCTASAASTTSPSASSAHLRGWRDSRPVRVGNGAWDQRQLDVYGELLNALHVYRERLGELHPEIQRFVADLADAAARRWHETRPGHLGDARRAAPPPVLEGACAGSALDRAVELAPDARRARARPTSGRPSATASARPILDARLERRRAGLRPGVRLRRARRRRAADADRRLPAGHRSADALDDRGDRQRAHRGRPRPALPQRRGPERRRARRRGGHLRDLHVLARLRLRPGRARSTAPQALFDRLVGYANDLGLLAEEIDTATGELLGNFPQAFSHIGLITAAADIDRAQALAGGA